MKGTGATLLLCLAASAFPSPITFNKDIAPIVFKNCAPCHRPGESGPFNLLTYDDVTKRAQQIVAVTKKRYMPPWLPEPGFGKFADERRLTDDQIALLDRWVAEGSPRGDAADLPPLPKFVEGWQLGEPDLMLRAKKPYTLAASGTDVYRNFIFSIPSGDVRYVRALEIRPGNKRVVHHANLLIDRNRSSRWKDGRDGQPGFPGMDLKIEANVQDPESHLLFWKPGSVISEEPPGMAWPVEPGTDLVLNMHLQPSGKPETIEPSLGLYFTKDAPTLRPLLVQLENDRSLDIPPGATNFTISDDFTLPIDVDVLGIYPHAHYLGRHVEAFATLPDGKRTPLIRIDDWNLNWQAVYRYETPVFLPKGTTIAMRWTYDNSTANPANPNHPPRRVTAGDRSTDEMGHVWLQLLPRGPGDQRMVIQEALMRKRVKRDPDDFTAHFNLGGVLAAKGDSDGAIHEVQEAVRIRPRDEVALNTLGAFLQLEHRTSEAEACYRRALEARPDYPDAHYNLANLLLEKGRTSEAIVHLREVVRLQPDDAKARGTFAETLDAQARGLAEIGQLAESIEAFRELVALKPSDLKAQTNLGVALARQSQFAEAKSIFERVLLIDPQNAPARVYLDRVNAILAKQP